MNCRLQYEVVFKTEALARWITHKQIRRETEKTGETGKMWQARLGFFPPSLPPSLFDSLASKECLNEKE